jgi:hypothetical protein
VPDTGTSYPLAGEEQITGADGKQTKTSAAGQLQYTNVAVQAVPQSWVQLIQTGPVLDPIKAGETPQLPGQ